MVTWKQRLVARILLLVAHMFADEPWGEEIKHLSIHIDLHAPRGDDT